jgi:hypothetical protein
MNLAELYIKAAAIIRTNGHSKGWFYLPPETTLDLPPVDCPVCVAGALSIALYGHPTPPARNELDDLEVAAARLLDSLDIAVHPDDIAVLRLATWNDASEQTADDVIAALESAARKQVAT